MGYLKWMIVLTIIAFIEGQDDCSGSNADTCCFGVKCVNDDYILPPDDSNDDWKCSR